jgi:hypothetical protein
MIRGAWWTMQTEPVISGIHNPLFTIHYWQ